MRRALALWLLLFGVYAATSKLDDYSGDEPHTCSPASRWPTTATWT
jgi:hypothetical protein